MDARPDSRSRHTGESLSFIRFVSKTQERVFQLESLGQDLIVGSRDYVAGQRTS